MKTVHYNRRILKELQQQINMSPLELHAWLRTDLAPITVANFSESLPLEASKKLLRIISKPEREVNVRDGAFLDHFLKRLLYLKRAKHLKHSDRTNWENSLRNMGYDIKKA